MSNMNTGISGTVVFDQSSSLTPAEAERNVIVRSNELQEAMASERALVAQVAALEEAFDRVRHDLVSVKNSLYELRTQTIPQRRRGLETAFNRQRAVTPIPAGPSGLDIAPPLSRALPQPGGFVEKERTAAFAKGTTPPQMDPKIAAQVSEDRRLYEISLAQIRARGITVPSVEAEEKKAENTAQKPAEETK